MVEAVGVVVVMVNRDVLLLVADFLFSYFFLGLDWVWVWFPPSLLMQIQGNLYLCCWVT